MLLRTSIPQEGADEDGAIGPFIQMRPAIEELRSDGRWQGKRTLALP